MNQYTSENPPKRGTARKIWKALDANGYNPVELHYNPNCWGADRVHGHGSWACMLDIIGFPDGAFCGILADGTVYIENLIAPYQVIIVTEQLHVG